MRCKEAPEVLYNLEVYLPIPRKRIVTVNGILLSIFLSICFVPVQCGQCDVRGSP